MSLKYEKFPLQIFSTSTFIYFILIHHLIPPHSAPDDSPNVSLDISTVSTRRVHFAPTVSAELAELLGDAGAAGWLRRQGPPSLDLTAELDLSMARLRLEAQELLDLSCRVASMYFASVFLFVTSDPPHLRTGSISVYNNLNLIYNLVLCKLHQQIIYSLTDQTLDSIRHESALLLIFPRLDTANAQLLNLPNGNCNYTIPDCVQKLSKSDFYTVALLYARSALTKYSMRQPICNNFQKTKMSTRASRSQSWWRGATSRDTIVTSVVHIKR